MVSSPSSKVWPSLKSSRYRISRSEQIRARAATAIAMEGALISAPSALPPVQLAQLVLRLAHQAPLRGAQVPPRAVLVEVQHRHRRPERPGLAPRAALRGPLQRQRDLPRAAREHAALQIQRVAALRHPQRPAAHLRSAPRSLLLRRHRLTPASSQYLASSERCAPAAERWRTNH